MREQAPDLEWLLALESGRCRRRPRSADLTGVVPLAEVLGTGRASVDPRVDDVSHPAPDHLHLGHHRRSEGDRGRPHALRRHRHAGRDLRLPGDERPYTGLSFTHNNAQATALAPALMSGYRAVLSRRFTSPGCGTSAARYGCTSFSLVGGMATAIYSEPPRDDDADNPVRLVVSGGMPARSGRPSRSASTSRSSSSTVPATAAAWRTSPPASGRWGPSASPWTASIMKILDEAGNECPPGVVGEICCRPEGGGEASVEYFGNPEASRKKIRDGWNRSGDMGHRDEEGWLYFDYRIGGAGIRHNGDFREPEFVEKVIAEDPQISDVFVYGVPAASGAPGEKDVVAAIALKEPDAFDPAALFAHCRNGLEPNFVPSHLQVVDAIPKTASEKPQERFLRDRFAPQAPRRLRPGLAKLSPCTSSGLG